MLCFLMQPRPVMRMQVSMWAVNMAVREFMVASIYPPSPSPSSSHALLVSSFLSAGIDVNVTNADGLTALHQVCFVQVCKGVLTLILQCCIENSLKVASILVMHGANVNATVRRHTIPYYTILCYLSVMDNFSSILFINAYI